MDPRSIDYLSSRVPRESAEPVLRALAAELEGQIPVAQLRSLAYMAGRRFGAQHGLGEIKTLADFELQANHTMADLNWGWMAVEEAAGAVDIVHGCVPLKRWFGDAAMNWSPGFLEGVYAEWMRQLGAGDRLDVREVVLPAGAGGEVLRFRLAHESSFS